MEKYECLSKLFTYSFFIVELLLQEGQFGHNTHTQMHTSTYLCSVTQNCLDPDKDGFGNLNEKCKAMKCCQND